MLSMGIDARISTMSDEYADSTLYRAQLLWGEGFLSPGGAEKVSTMMRDVDIENTEVLDLGSGLGGPTLLLAEACGARKVIGIDIEPKLVELSSALAAKAGLSDRVEFRLVEPGPLRFDDASFDAVFTSGAILHVEDKLAVLEEVHRVLRAGGRLLTSDWFRGTNSDESAATRLFELLGLTVKPDTAEERIKTIRAAGFIDIDALDASERETAILASDYERLVGPLKDEVVAAVGGEGYRNSLEIRSTMHSAFATRSLGSTHIWASKPG